MQKNISHVGLDVHQGSIAIAELEGWEKTPRIWQIPNDPKVIRRTFAKLTSGREVRACYEAGPCGYELFRFLTSMGVHCEVIAPGLIPTKPGDRIKTDRRDAAKLAHLFRAGELTSVHVPTSDEEAVRDLVRAREDVHEVLIAARHRLLKFLLRHGRVYSAGVNWTQRHFGWLRKLTFERQAENIVFVHYLAEVVHLYDRRSALDREIAIVATTETYAPQVGRLSCLRGISTLSAMILLAEVHDFRRFAHPRDLMAYLGLVPSEYSSGGTRKRGSITKTGNSHARRILIEAAWQYRHRPLLNERVRKALAEQPPPVVAVAERSQLRLHRRFTRLVSRGKSVHVAVTAVARELSGFVWAMANQKAA